MLTAFLHTHPPPLLLLSQGYVCKFSNPFPYRGTSIQRRVQVQKVVREVLCSGMTSAILQCNHTGQKGDPGVKEVGPKVSWILYFPLSPGVTAHVGCWSCCCCCRMHMPMYWAKVCVCNTPCQIWEETGLPWCVLAGRTVFPRLW